VANETGQRDESKVDRDLAADEVKTGATLDDLGHRLQEAEGLDEDLALTVARNWQSLLGGLVVVLIGVWVFGQYRSSKQETIAAASSKLSELQDAYPGVVLSKAVASGEKADDAASKSAEDIAKLQTKAFNDTINKLKENFGDTFYARLAPLYEAQRLIADGDYGNAYRLLEQIGLKIVKQDSWPKGERQIGETELVEELAALQFLRAKMQDPESVRADTRNAAELLVQRGSFTAVEASLLLYRTAENDDERNQSLEAARALRKDRPFLAIALETAFEEAGAKL
jgi:hypothetical protein